MKRILITVICFLAVPILINAASARQPRGSVVVSNGTVYYLGEVLRYPFPSREVFFSWGHTFAEVVPANSADLASPLGPIVDYKPLQQPLPPPPTQLRPVINYFYAVPDVYSISKSPRLIWSISNSKNQTLQAGLAEPKDVQNKNQETASPQSSTIYKLTARNDYGTVYKTVVVRIGTLEGDTVTVRDAIRVIDIDAIRAALDIYFIENGKYPASLNDLTTFLSPVPKAPTTVDGFCTTALNQYIYKPAKNDSSYELSFCLGQGGEYYNSGLNTVIPKTK